MPLKGIPQIISPELLKALAEMGHGDEIVIGDSNFPAVSISEAQKQPRLIQMSGHSGPAILSAIVKIFPLDSYVECPAAVMALVPSDEAKGVKAPIWDEYRKILVDEEKRDIKVEHVERFQFYERAKKCFAVIASGEEAIYANIILKKGIITTSDKNKK